MSPRNTRRGDESREKVAIIGGGIGGLTTAYTLMQRGQRCDLFEASHTTGGAIRTIREDGWVMELGPNTLLDRGGVLTALVDDLGLTHERLYPSGASNARFIVRGGEPIALPTSPAKLLNSKLFSGKAKLRLLAEPWVSPREDADELDESLYNFAARRLGEELVDYALDPFLAGTYAGKPEQLSSRHALKRLREFEEMSGSIFRGAFTSLREAKRARAESNAPPPPRATLMSFTRGVQTITDALTDALGDRVHCGAKVEALVQQRETMRWMLRGDGLDVASEQGYDEVIVFLPAHVIAAMEVTPASGERADLSAFAEINHPPISMISLGFERSAFRHPLDGFGMLIPSKEPFEHLGCVFASSIFADRAPRGHVQLVAFFGGARHPESALWEESRQVDTLLEELHTLLGLEPGRAPVKIERRTWRHAIPQYEVGYGHILERIEAIEASQRGLRFAGNWRDGIAVPDVVALARRLAHS